MSDPERTSTAESLVLAGESETVEFKEAWNDADALRELAAFANTLGGTLLIGVDDSGRVLGWKNGGRTIDGLTNKVSDSLRIHPSTIRVEMVGGAPVLRITVTRSPSPVSLRGRYYRRVGRTVREMLPNELQQILLTATGNTWDSVMIPDSVVAISEDKLEEFAGLAEPRLPRLRETAGDRGGELALGNLNLLRDGNQTRAAILLFGSDPQSMFVDARVHMGRFKAGMTIVDDKWFGGTLLEQIDGVMQQFRQYLEVGFIIPSWRGHTKASKLSVAYENRYREARNVEGLQRLEVWEYPLDALREAVINALIHRDYNQLGCIDIRVFDDHIVVSNPGGLPGSLTVEALRTEGHASIRRNPLLAQTLYYAGLVEQWGTGTVRMAQACEAQGLPDPLFEAWPNRFAVTLYNSPYRDSRLQTLGLSDRQMRIFRHARKVGATSNLEVQGLVEVSGRTALRDLNALEDAGLLQRTSQTGRRTRYEVVETLLEEAKSAVNPP